jgi:hypothetical protein
MRISSLLKIIVALKNKINTRETLYSTFIMTKETLISKSKDDTVSKVRVGSEM